MSLELRGSQARDVHLESGAEGFLKTDLDEIL